MSVVPLALGSARGAKAQTLKEGFQSALKASEEVRVQAAANDLEAEFGNPALQTAARSKAVWWLCGKTRIIWIRLPSEK